MGKKGKEAPEETTDVATIPEGGALAVSDYGDDIGAGFEDVSQDDLLIPFLVMLQKMSPLVDEEQPQYIEGAKAGMIMNSVTEELYPGDEGVVFVPVHKTHRYLEWVPRDSGGGFRGSHDPSDPMVMEAIKGQAFGKAESPDGNDLVETFSVFGLVVDADGGFTPSVISFSSTQIKAYKRWMTQMRSIQLRDAGTGRRVTPPMFAHTFRLRSRSQTNDKGTWHGWTVGFSEPADRENGVGAAEASRLAPTDELYVAAKEVRDLVVSEAVKMAYDTVAPEEGVDGEEGSDVF